MKIRLLLIALSLLNLPCDGQRNREEIIEKSKKTRRLPSLDVCGKSKFYFTDRIVNGRPADLGAYPWIALMGFRTRFRDISWECAGSLITDQYILTAAHCFHPLGSKNLTTIRLGELDKDPLVDDGATPTDYIVDNFILHHGYNDNRKVNDIALVRLADKVTYTELIRPICLPPPEFHINSFIGHAPIVAGWGSTILRGSASTRLLEAEVEIQDTKECSRNITSVEQFANATVDSRVICAASPGTDACQGDSGGPLMFSRIIKDFSAQNSSGNMFLMGIVAYGYGCAIEGYPGVYTRVSEYIPWIVENLDI